MSVPLSATGRITQQYPVGGVDHKMRVYVRNPTVVGGTYNINTRTLDQNDLDWTLASNDLGTALSYLLPAGTTLPDAVLETQAGGIWTVVATHTPTITQHASGTGAVGFQVTVVFRDVLLKKVKWVVIEPNVSVLLHHQSWAALNAQSAVLGNFTKEFLSTHALTNAPYIWAVSRGNQYLNTSPFVGVTTTTNRRVRRRRGLT